MSGGWGDGGGGGLQDIISNIVGGMTGATSFEDEGSGYYYGSTVKRESAASSYAARPGQTFKLNLPNIAPKVERNSGGFNFGETKSSRLPTIVPTAFSSAGEVPKPKGKRPGAEPASNAGRMALASPSEEKRGRTENNGSEGEGIQFLRPSQEVLDNEARNNLNFDNFNNNTTTTTTMEGDEETY